MAEQVVPAFMPVKPYLGQIYERDGEAWKYAGHPDGWLRLYDPAVPLLEAVDHPKHYNSHPSGIECIEIVRHHNFNTGNAMKYLWRCGLKDGHSDVEDLRKAVWYLNDEIERLGRELVDKLNEPPF